MAMETYMVRLKQPVTPERKLALSIKVDSLGGKVELNAEKGTFLISLDDSRVGDIRGMNIVALVGGVTMNRRWVVTG